MASVYTDLSFIPTVTSSACMIDTTYIIVTTNFIVPGT